MYSELENIRGWLERVAVDFGYPSDLAGLCAVSAAKVHLRLKRAGYNCRIIYNEYHCFNVVDNQIVDCTASQFNLPDIYVGPFPDSRWFYKPDRIFKKASELIRFQRQECWYPSQIYDYYI